MKRLLKVIQSLFAGLIGVQSEKKRQEDFQSGNIYEFIIGGIVMTVCLLLLTALAVRLIIS